MESFHHQWLRDPSEIMTIQNEMKKRKLNLKNEKEKWKNSSNSDVITTNTHNGKLKYANVVLFLVAVMIFMGDIVFRFASTACYFI